LFTTTLSLPTGAEELLQPISQLTEGTETWQRVEIFEERTVDTVFKPKEPGIDHATQLLDHELVHFEQAVEPLLQVLVGVSVDQGLAEVIEEEERKSVEVTRARFEQRRDVLLAEAQRLSQGTKRLLEERERRLAQAEQQATQDKARHYQLEVRAVAKEFAVRLTEQAVERLGREGAFYDPVERQVQDDFMPWLEKRVANELDQFAAAQRIVDDLLRAAACVLQAA